MPKAKKLEKIYKTNNDTISINVEQFSTELGLFPYNGVGNNFVISDGDVNKVSENLIVALNVQKNRVK